MIKGYLEKQRHKFLNSPTKQSTAPKQGAAPKRLNNFNTTHTSPASPDTPPVPTATPPEFPLPFFRQ